MFKADLFLKTNWSTKRNKSGKASKYMLITVSKRQPTSIAFAIIENCFSLGTLFNED